MFNVCVQPYGLNNHNSVLYILILAQLTKLLVILFFDFPPHRTYHTLSPKLSESGSLVSSSSIGQKYSMYTIARIQWRRKDDL